LTLKVEVWLLHTTSGLIFVKICAKLFQNPLIDENFLDRTAQILSNR
jgi:hypothetical protein